MNPVFASSSPKRAHLNASLGDSNRLPRLLVLIFLVGIVIWGLYKVARVFLLVENISGDARALTALTENGSFAQLEAAPTELTDRLKSLKTDIHDLHSEVGVFAYVLPLLGWMPRYGGEASQAPTLLEFADSTAEGAYTTLVLFEKVSAGIDAGRSKGQPVGVAALAAIQDNQDGITTARADLARANAARQSLDVTRLGDTTRGLVTRLDRLFPLWSTAVNAFALAPTLLGGNRPQEFLFIIQNSDELRPTGGFISSVIKIRMDRGDIAELDYRDSYAVDNPDSSKLTPPAPLGKYMELTKWSFRDANWSPDFPTSAQDMLRIYKLDQGATPDGVIATNLKMLAGLMQSLGPINVEGTSQKVSASNALPILQSYYDSPAGQGHTADWWYHRKDFAGRLLVSALENIRNGQFDKTQFIHLLSDAIASKELLFYLNDSAAQEVADSADWSGRIGTRSGDELMIVDSNLGYNKTDPNVRRHATYSVEVDQAGNGTAHLVLTYDNINRASAAECVHEPYYPPTYAEMQQGCYWDYLRILSAPNAQLLSAPNDIEAGSEDPVQGRSAFFGFFVLPRASTRQVQYDWQLPRVVEDGRTYRLHIDKQPGAPTWKILVRVTLPAADQVESNLPPQRVNGRTLEYDLTLDHDIDLVIARPQSLLSNLALSLISAVLSLGVLGVWWSRRRRVSNRPPGRILN